MLNRYLNLGRSNAYLRKQALWYSFNANILPEPYEFTDSSVNLMFNVAAVKKENKIRHKARLLCFNVFKNLVFATCFEVRQNKQSLFVKIQWNSGKSEVFMIFWKWACLVGKSTYCFFFLRCYLHLVAVNERN